MTLLLRAACSLRHPWRGLGGRGALPAWGFLVAGLTGAVAYGASDVAAFDQAIYHVVGLGAAAAVFLGVHLSRPAEARAWCLVGAGMVFTGCGDLIFDIAEWRGNALPFPSAADAVYLLGYALFAVGLFMIGRRAVAPRGRELIDYGVVGTTVALVLFSVLIGPTLDEPGSLLAHVTSAAYPVLDAVLIVAILPLALRRARSVSVTCLLAFATLTFGVDLVYGLEILHGTYVPGGWLDTLWLVSFSALGAGALHPSMRHAASQLNVPGWSDRGRFVATGLAALVVLWVLATTSPAWTPDFYFSAALIVLVLGLIFVRVGLLQTHQRRAQLGLERELRRLEFVDAVQREVVADVTDLEALLERICEHVRAVIGAGGVAVALLDDGELHLRVLVGETGLSVGDRVDSTSLSSAAMAADTVLFTHDARTDGRIDRRLASMSSSRSVVAAPVHYGGAPIGAIVAVHSEPAAFDRHDGNTLQLMASLVSVAVNRSEDFAARLALDAIVEATEDAIVRRTLDGTIVGWNAGAERVFGYAAEEMVGGPIAVLLPDDLENPMVGEDELQRASPIAYESVRVRKDGRRIGVAVIATLVRDAHGRPAGITAIIRDITERNELEEQLHHAQKMEAIGRLAGGVAHDFNNLLLAIGGYSSFILADLDASPAVVRNAEGISVACNRAAELTGQLLAYSRRQVLETKQFDPNEVIDETRKMLERMVGENIRVVCRLDAKAGYVAADPGRLSQIVMNLAVNARDAMPDGGDLTIETTKVRLDADEAGQLGGESGSYVRLTVADNGTGMDEETRAHIFEPFFTTKPEGRGTGLGLATVYGTVKQSGGCVDVVSVLGNGTIVSVYLPACAAPALALPPDPDAALEEAVDGDVVLLVEDQETVRSVVREMLLIAGYEVVDAEDGEEALELAETLPRIDVLVSDIVMPGMDGRTLAARFRECHPDVRIVLTSGYSREGAVVPRSDRSMAFVQKPFTATALTTAIRSTRERAAV